MDKYRITIRIISVITLLAFVLTQCVPAYALRQVEPTNGRDGDSNGVGDVEQDIADMLGIQPETVLKIRNSAKASGDSLASAKGEFEDQGTVLQPKSGLSPSAAPAGGTPSLAADNNDGRLGITPRASANAAPYNKSTPTSKIMVLSYLL